jgi:hypothetical protein
LLVFFPFVMWAWPDKKEQQQRLPPEIDPLAEVGR